MPDSEPTPQPERRLVTTQPRLDASTPLSVSTDLHVPETSDDLATGAVPDSPPGYELLGELARGGMGVVYRARDTRFDREVAVKLIGEKYRHDADARTRFLAEARITGRLQHPGVPPVHDLGTLADGRPYLAMKLITGRTLDAILASDARPNLVAVFEAICQAIAYAHARGVIHRDLKPLNVMVGSFGEVQVMDWGLARAGVGNRESGVRDDTDRVAATRSGAGDDAETAAGTVMGTPAYMAPEQARGETDRVDARADVFGLGAILCAVLTGRPPFEPDGNRSTLAVAQAGDLTRAFDRLDRCGADADLIALGKRCLAAEPERRPAQAGAVAEAVRAHLAGVEDRARRAELERAEAEVRTREQRKRHTVQLALAASLLLLAGLGGLGAWWWERVDSQRKAAAFQQQIDDERRAAEERSRLTRNDDAITALVVQCEKALKTDADAADAALVEIDRRLPEGGGETLTIRIDRCRTDLALLRELDTIDQFRWTPAINQLPDFRVVAARIREGFARFGLEPQTSPMVATKWLADSLIRDRLLATLDLWLVFEPSVGVRAILATADPDIYRDAVRDAVLANDVARVAELVGQADALTQPVGFAAALGQNSRVPVTRRRAVLQLAQRVRPADLTLLMALGNTYSHLQREGAEGQVRWFQAAVAAHPRNGAAYYNLGIALYLLEDRDGAIAAYREAIRFNPKSVYAYNNLGIALATKGDWNAAIVAYEESIRLNPENANAHTNLGIALANIGDRDRAISCHREAIRLDPKLALAHYNLGIALGNKGDRDGSVAAFREATRLNPKNTNAHINLGIALATKGDWNAAIAAYEESIRLNPKIGAAYKHLGVALASKGDRDGAIAAFREATRLDPKDANAHYNLGLALRAKGDRDGAVASFKEAVRFNPKDANAHNNLGTTLAIKGDWDAAVISFQNALRLDPKNPGYQQNLDRALKDKAEWDAKEGRVAPPPREVKR